ncbi:unnamed protein product [Laminaria digitata]
MSTWYTDEDKISAEDLAAHEAPKFRIGHIPVDPPPRRFCNQVSRTRTSTQPHQY